MADLTSGLACGALMGHLDRGYWGVGSALRLVVVGVWLARSEILRVAQRVCKKKKVEGSRQGENCHSEGREESLWKRLCLEPKIHPCDYRLAAQLILRFAQYITNYVMSDME